VKICEIGEQISCFFDRIFKNKAIDNDIKENLSRKKEKPRPQDEVFGL
jgi:hypothetical protein